MIERVKSVFSIDFRSLGIFRICLAFILILDLIIRAFALTAHYTDFGVLPLDIYLGRFVNSQWISLHNLNGSIFYQSFLFFVSFLFAFSMLVGYKTKISTVVSWFLLISLHSRNPVVLQGGDVMLRLLLFWAIFLPLNIRYSVDSKFGKVKNLSGENIFSFGSVGILLQVAFVYFFSALLKTGNEWFPDGSAIYYALQLDQFATYFGKFLLNFPELLFYLTYLVYFIELVGPILLFVPFFFKQIRVITTFAFIFTLIGMALSLRLGHFPFVGITAFILFLPSIFWDKISYKLSFLRNKVCYIHRELDYLSNNFWKEYLNVLINVVALIFIIYIFLWNVQSINNINAVPDDFEFVAHKFRIDQRWDMFSPFPLKEDGWYVIEGVLINGKKIDLFRDGALVNYEKPKHIASLYKGERWRKYLMNLWGADYAQNRVYYLNYLCRDWNEKHFEDLKLNNVSMNFMLEITLPDYKVSHVEKVVLEEVDCLK